jgi:hypothetical protein
MQGEQIHLLGRLDRHEGHGGPLHRLGDGFGIAVVVLVALQKRFDVLGRDQAHVMAERLQLPADVVGARTGLHADQARRNVGQALRELEPGELDPQHDGAALVLTDKVEAILAQIDAKGGDRSGRRGP